jgi:hypothetical protein
MSNDYFNHSANTVAAGSRAVADDINDVADEIAVGFDKLPTEAEIKEDRIAYAVDSGAADAYVVTLPYTPTLTAGMKVVFKATNANTGASTLNVSGTGVKSLNLDATTALSAGDIAANDIVECRYDGTVYQVLAKTNSAAGIKTLYESNSDTNAFNDADAALLDAVGSEDIVHTGGGQTIGGTLAVTGTVTFSGNIQPPTDYSGQVGTISKRLGYMYCNQLYGNNLVPNSNGSGTVGSTGTRYANAFINNIDASGTINSEAYLNANGVVNMPNLPTYDPAVAGQLWNNSGVLTVSAG